MTENPVITFNPEDWNGTISQLMNLAAILLSPEDREAIGKNPEWDRPNYFLTDDEDDNESYFTVSLNYPLEEGETGPKIAINVMILFNKIQAYATPRNGGDSILAVEVPIDSTVARGLCICFDWPTTFMNADGTVSLDKLDKYIQAEVIPALTLRVDRPYFKSNPHITYPIYLEDIREMKRNECLPVYKQINNGPNSHIEFIQVVDGNPDDNAYAFGVMFIIFKHVAIDCDENREYTSTVQYYSLIDHEITKMGEPIAMLGYHIQEVR